MSSYLVRRILQSLVFITLSTLAAYVVISSVMSTFLPRGMVTEGPSPRVIELIGKSWGYTASLIGAALLITILVAVPLGLFVASRPHSRLDHAVTFFSSLGLSVPLFGLGLILIIALAILPYQWNTNNGWSWLPYLPPGSPFDYQQENNLLNRLYHVALPAVTLAIPQIAILTRYVRASMLEVLGLDYIRTARAKGLPAWRVLGKHAFRNAALPIITAISLAIPGIISGAIIVEYLFGFEGLGGLMFETLGGCVPTQERPCPPGGFGIRDPMLVKWLILLLFVVIAVANMIADILYAAADPRVEHGSKASRSG
ncbi:MAG TPA: ABC transporter permease [Chloroflexia bacterium]|nr:ABC transporter permease [Chloroflexia bacterium]